MIDFDRVIDNSIQEYTHDLNNEFAAPEVETKELYSEKSDIYSLGKVIEFILKKINYNNLNISKIYLITNLYPTVFCFLFIDKSNYLKKNESQKLIKKTY